MSDTDRAPDTPGAVQGRADARPLSLKAQALRLLAQREHSRQELERKLLPHADTPEALSQALDALQARGFINDERVADSVLHRRASKLGTARVRAELQAKGLDAAVVQAAVETLRGTEVERAHAVWQRKFGEPPANPSERARQMRFLAARGFGADAIRHVIRGADED
jgi:regulatory protein